MIWHPVCTDLHRAVWGLVQGILCSVSFLRCEIQHRFGSSHNLYKCCRVKKCEKFKAKSVQCSGRRHCIRSSSTWNLKVYEVKFTLKLIVEQWKLEAWILCWGLKHMEWWVLSLSHPPGGCAGSLLDCGSVFGFLFLLCNPPPPIYPYAMKL